LKSTGVTGKLIDWLRSYLSNRRQRVVLNGASFTYLEIKAGVPQGSVLGPILFLVYINDLAESIISDLFLFADDSTLLDVFSENAFSIQKVINDLLTIEKWSKIWLVDFNPIKTVGITFSVKRAPSPLHDLLFFGKIVKEVTTHKHLGLLLNHRLSWDDHLDYINSKCMRQLSILKRLKNSLPR
jgi:hypothetical protein